MQTQEALETLDAMQRQVIHGSTVFRDIGDVIRNLTLSWTEKPPDQEGWYWIRFAGVEARLVSVAHNGTTLEYYISGMGKFNLFYPPSHFVEFAGPVREPSNNKMNEPEPTPPTDSGRLPDATCSPADVLRIRCIHHINVPQQNTAEHTGAECGGCIAAERDALRSKLEQVRRLAEHLGFCQQVSQREIADALTSILNQANAEVSDPTEEGSLH